MDDLSALEGGAPQIKQGITGRVTDASTGEGMIEAQVIVVGRDKKVITDLDGNFAIELPPGAYTLRSFYELYEPQRVENIVVRAGEVSQVEIKLGMQESAVDEVDEAMVVTARADRATDATQLSIRKESASVRDAISAQEISRSGANNAADAIRRVVSATVDPSNRLIVRGLGSRYTRVLLHNFRIPSTDPDDPGIELDLFPSGVLSNLSVLKTFTPDLPGDFAGGVMQIETRDFPDQLLLQTNVSLGYNTEATFQNVLDYDGGKLDWLGFDDGARALPGAVPNEYISSKRTIQNPNPAFTPEEVEEIGESFEPSYGVYDETGLPNMSAGLVVGDTLRVFNKDFGYLAAFGYQNRTSRRVSRIHEAQATQDADGNTEYFAGSDFTDERGAHQASWGGLTTFNLELTERSDLTLTTLLSQSGTREANFAKGRSLDTIDFAQRRLRWVERQLFFSQLRGEHREIPKLHDLTVDWNVSTARASREEPDTRTVRYNRTGTGAYEWTGNIRSPGRFFSDYGEWTIGSQLDLALPVVDEVKLKVGAQTRHAWADFGSRRFTFEENTSLLPADANFLSPDELFSPTYIGNGLDLREGTINTDGYEASSGLLAGYAMAEVLPLKTLRLVGGARLEHFGQKLEPVSPTANQPPDPEDEVDETNDDVLPAGAAIVTLADDMFLRASYGMTVARPLFRELAPFVYEDDIRRISVSGNPDLKRSRIHNADLRWEIFPGTNEVVAVTGFYKKFIDPIEPYQVGSTRSFQNAQGATNVGAELETRLSLGRLAEALDWFQVGANFTYVYSRIEIAEPGDKTTTNTNSKRPLSGQSPYVANLSLGVSDPASGSSLFAYYNVFGKRIDQVGANNLPDQYELPFHSLDLIGSYRFDDHWSLNLKAQNLAFQKTRIKEGPIMREKFNPGTTITVGGGWTY